MKRMLCLLVAFAISFSASVQAGEMGETEKVSAFAKAYAAAKPEDRVAAVQLLQGTKKQASFLCLVRVANIDVEPAVRLAAYNLITEWDDPRGRLHTVVLNIFNNEKNRDNKIAMLKAFPQMKLKTQLTEAAIKYLNYFTYPGSYDRDRDRDRDFGGFGGDGGDGGDGGGGALVGQRSKESIARARKEFTEVLGAINSLTGQSFPARNRARELIKKWWIMNKAEFAKKDAATLKQLEAAAREAEKKAREAKAKELAAAQAAEKNAAGKTDENNKE